jgi:hypothetical protein
MGLREMIEDGQGLRGGRRKGEGRRGTILTEIATSSLPLYVELVNKEPAVPFYCHSFLCTMALKPFPIYKFLVFIPKLPRLRHKLPGCVFKIPALK